MPCRRVSSLSARRETSASDPCARRRSRASSTAEMDPSAVRVPEPTRSARSSASESTPGPCCVSFSRGRSEGSHVRIGRYPVSPDAPAAPGARGVPSALSLPSVAAPDRSGDASGDGFAGASGAPGLGEEADSIAAPVVVDVSSGDAERGVSGEGFGGMAAGRKSNGESVYRVDTRPPPNITSSESEMRSSTGPLQRLPSTPAPAHSAGARSTDCCVGGEAAPASPRSEPAS